MLVTWDKDRPLRCTEHGQLADEPVPNIDAGIAALEHLRDAHGTNVDEALAKARAYRAWQEARPDRLVPYGPVQRWPCTSS